MFTKGTKSTGRVSSKVGKLTKGRLKQVTKNSNTTGTLSVGSTKGFKGTKLTKGRTKQVTTKSTGAVGTKSIGSTKGFSMGKSSTVSRNPKSKRPVVKPLQLG